MFPRPVSSHGSVPEGRQPAWRPRARAGLTAAAAATAWLLLVACTGTPPPVPQPPPEADWDAELQAEAERLASWLEGLPAADDGALVIRLAFGSGADLDLYVTGPAKETIYYANTPARTGGALDRDRRCGEDDDPVGAETIRFGAPLAGAYRVGVDYPDACGEAPEVVPFAIAIDAADGRRTLRGLARPRVFVPIVDAFDWPPPGGGPAPAGEGAGRDGAG